MRVTRAPRCRSVGTLPGRSAAAQAPRDGDGRTGDGASSRLRPLPEEPTVTTSFSPAPLDRVLRGAVTVLGSLPAPVQRLLAGRPTVVDGQRLETEVQLALRALHLVAGPTFETLPVADGRQQISAEAWAFGGPRPQVGSSRDLHVPGPGGPIPARLHLPHRTSDHAGRPLPMLVYFHGGGWVLGDVDSHDHLCRLLCARAEVAVLNVGYRLAPEHRFPAAVDDATAAFAWAVEQAETLGVDAGRIAVGGDSAGGNLAAVVAQVTTAAGGPRPAYQLLFVPVTDLSRRTRSYELFGDGYFLTAAQMDWYQDHYLGPDGDPTDPRVSPLLAEDLRGLPPAYVGVAGFDPLRDEGLAYGRAMAAAGVPVALRCHEGLVHPFSNAIGVGRTGRAAVVEAAGALRAGLA
ncbi:alpha/beta hydrolase [Nitriliruptoraceae bacterium ZYF776]|nr:alpha/beta hydrolase [Profundirhabdus halotolerans]